MLRFGGDRVYGCDASNDRLLVSEDRGRTWRGMERPAPLIDLAVHPGDGRRIVASTEAGLFGSSDGGASWRPMSEGAGLLAWPSPETLYLVDGRGDTYVSPDEGTSWSARGTIGGQPAALLGQPFSELYAALHDGTIKRSADGGQSWTTRSTP